MKGVIPSQDIIDFITVVTSKSIERHNVPFGTITFVAENCISVDDERFTGRDKVLGHKLATLIVKDLFDENQEYEDDKCEFCYPTTEIEPLDWKNVNVEKEWIKGVPLQVRLLFYSYLNNRTICRTNDIKIYMHRN